MKKKLSKTKPKIPVDVDEILPEYDFSHAMPNKYAARYTSFQMTSPSEFQASIPLDCEAPFVLGFSDRQLQQAFVSKMRYSTYGS